MPNDGNFLAYMVGRGQQFQAYGAGKKRYGMSGRSAPNIGPVGDKSGYRQRDADARIRRNAMLARLQAGQRGDFMSKNYLDPLGRSF
jgi:hypothetical protein